MKRLAKIVKLTLVGLISLLYLGEVNGVKCYECIEAKAELLTGTKVNTEGMTCKDKISKGLTTDCADAYCIKASGTVKGGNKVEYRSCAGDNFKGLLGGIGCKPVKQVESFRFAIGAQGLEPESGDICVCGTDKCNPAAHVVSYRIYSFITVGIVLTFFCL